jgi:hypothetical protein
MPAQESPSQETMKRHSLLDELRVQYEAMHEPADAHHDVESFEAIDARMRKAFHWLEQAVTYLNGLKPPIAVLEDLVRLILGRDSAFLRRAPLAGLRRG